VRLEDLLLSEGLLDQAALAELIMYRADHGGGLDTAVLELGLVDEPRLIRLLERACDLKNRVDPLGVPEPGALQKLSRAHAERYHAVPLRLVARHLDVLVRDAADLGVIDELGFITGLHIHPAVAPEPRVAAQLHGAYGIAVPPRLGLALTGNPEARRDWEQRLAARQIPAQVAPGSELTPPPVFEEGLAIHDAHLAELVRDATVPDAGPPTVTLVEPIEVPPGDEPIVEPTPEPSYSIAVPIAVPVAFPGPEPEPLPARQYDEVAALIDHATDLAEVSAVALDYLTSFLPRAVLFSVRRDRLAGWDARGGRLRRETVAHVSVSLDEPSIFGSAAITGAYSGPLPRGPLEEELIVKLGGESWPEHVLITAVKVQGKPVAILYCEAPDADARSAAHEPVGVICGFLADACRRLIFLKKKE
jgi:Type II secretion system (T2SS), protein E, N-terminal domain